MSNQSETVAVGEAMRKYGGADKANAAKIKETWPKMWAAYLEIYKIEERESATQRL